MGAKKSKPVPLPPPPTLKELMKKSTRSIKKMQRGFGRERRKLETANKKIERDIKKMLKKGEPRTNIRLVAQGLVKNRNFMKKYDRLDAQLGNCIFQLNSAATMEVLTTVMQDMNKIFNRTQGLTDPKTVQRTAM